MSNFWKKQVAQESANAVLEPGSIELPEEAVEAHMEDVQSDTGEIELLDRDAAILEDDADESEAQADLIAEGEEGGEDMSEDDVEALDVAQESIRKRWGIERRSVGQESAGSSRSRRMIAHESVMEDIKGLIKRFIEWLKEQGRKVKDRWMKFSNAGKTIQARSKKFEGKLRNLGSKKKDTLTGAFIKQLSVDGKFVGDNLTTLKDDLKTAQDTQIAQGLIYEFAIESAEKILKGTEVSFSDIAQVYRSSGFASERGTNIVGNMTVNSKEEADNYNLEFIEGSSDVATEVPTPSSTQLSTLNDFYNIIGKDLEKELQAYRKTDTARGKLEKAMEKILAAAGKKEGEEGGEKAAGHARKLAQRAAASASIAAKVGAHIWKTLPTGVNGYLVAGIGAYGK